jgi:hypothetical protein
MKGYGYVYSIPNVIRPKKKIYVFVSGDPTDSKYIYRYFLFGEG